MHNLIRFFLMSRYEDRTIILIHQDVQGEELPSICSPKNKLHLGYVNIANRH